MYRPFQMAFLGNTLYVADGGTVNGNTTEVYTVATSGNRTLVAGNNGSSNNVFAESLGGLAVSPTGTVFVSEATGPHAIYKIDTSSTTATVTTLTSALNSAA